MTFYRLICPVDLVQMGEVYAVWTLGDRGGVDLIGSQVQFP